MIAPAQSKRKNYRHQFSTLEQGLLKSLDSPGVVRAEILGPVQDDCGYQA
jgi:hypothetical protein